MQKFLFLTLLLLSAAARAEIEIGDITIIGEIHQHAESPAFFQRLVTDALQHSRCITVVLEIASNQQTVLDQIQAGKASPADLEISSIIDHPKYRKMIGNLAAETQHVACLRLLAIDAGDDVDMHRDQQVARMKSGIIGATFAPDSTAFHPGYLLFFCSSLRRVTHPAAPGS